MDAMVTSPTPAKDEMGMDYVPVYADEAVPPRGGGVEGLATVRAGDDVLQRSGVQTAPAVRATAGRKIRTVGIVVPDETRVRHVQTKVEGWIEKLYVNYTGQYVAAGGPLASIYSPELLSTQEEYLRAKKTAAQFTSSPDPQVRSIGEDLVRSAHRRLELYDVPESFIAALEKKGKPQKAVNLVAPFAGYVTVKDVFEGHQVEPGMELFTLTDLSTGLDRGLALRVRGQRRGGREGGDADALPAAGALAQGQGHLRQPRALPGEPHADGALRVPEPGPRAQAADVRRCLPRARRLRGRRRPGRRPDGHRAAHGGLRRDRAGELRAARRQSWACAASGTAEILSGLREGSWSP